MGGDQIHTHTLSCDKMIINLYVVCLKQFEGVVYWKLLSDSQ